MARLMIGNSRVWLALTFLWTTGCWLGHDYSNCEADSDCESTHQCLDSLCTPRPGVVLCSSGSDSCPTGQICNVPSGVCVFDDNADVGAADDLRSDSNEVGPSDIGSGEAGTDAEPGDVIVEDTGDDVADLGGEDAPTNDSAGSDTTDIAGADTGVDATNDAAEMPGSGEIQVINVSYQLTRAQVVSGDTAFAQFLAQGANTPSTSFAATTYEVSVENRAENGDLIEAYYGGDLMLEDGDRLIVIIGDDYDEEGQWLGPVVHVFDEAFATPSPDTIRLRVVNLGLDEIALVGERNSSVSLGTIEPGTGTASEGHEMPTQERMWLRLSSSEEDHIRFTLPDLQTRGQYLAIVIGRAHDHPALESAMSVVLVDVDSTGDVIRQDPWVSFLYALGEKGMFSVNVGGVSHAEFYKWATWYSPFQAHPNGDTVVWGADQPDGGIELPVEPLLPGARYLVMLAGSQIYAEFNDMTAFVFAEEFPVVSEGTARWSVVQAAHDLERADEITLVDASDMLVDRITNDELGSAYFGGFLPNDPTDGEVVSTAYSRGASFVPAPDPGHELVVSSRLLIGTDVLTTYPLTVNTGDAFILAFLGGFGDGTATSYLGRVDVSTWPWGFELIESSSSELLE